MWQGVFPELLVKRNQTSNIDSLERLAGHLAKHPCQREATGIVRLQKPPYIRQLSFLLDPNLPHMQSQQVFHKK